MSGTLDIHRPDRDTAIRVPSMDGWLGFFARSGVFAVMFVGLLWFLGTHVFMPMQEENRRRNDETAAQTKAFQTAVIASNEQHAAAATVTSRAITGLEENSRRTLEVLQRIEADQRRGVWNETRPKGGSGE